MIYEMWEAVPGPGGPYGQNEFICRVCGVFVKDLWISNNGKMAREVHEEWHTGLSATAKQANQASVWTNVIG
jgi:hypothetical protein